MTARRTSKRPARARFVATAGSLLLAAATLRADTGITFAISAGTDAVAVGANVTLTVAASFDERLAGCAFDLVVVDGAADLTERAVAPGLRYLATSAENPLATELPRMLADGERATEVLLNLDAVDPPGGPQDGVMPGANVILATYTVKAIQGGTLRIALANPRAVETQSDTDGALFDAVVVDPNHAETVIMVFAMGDIHGDGHVDLRDYATLQACAAPTVAGACAAADLDSDGDVDAADLADLVACLGGPGEPNACVSRTAPATNPKATVQP